MDKYTETQAATPTFEEEVTRILEGNDRVQRVEFDGEHTWTLSLRGCVDMSTLKVRQHDCDEAETARLEIVDDLTETLGEDVCGGLEFWSKSFCEQNDTRIELEVLDEDGGEEENDDDFDEPDKADYLDRFLTLTGKHHFEMGVIISDMAGAVAQRMASQKGQAYLDDETFRPMYRCLRRADAPAKQWKSYIDSATDAICRRILEAEAACVTAVAGALDLDESTAKDILDQYSFDLDEREYPTSSFMRWYRHPRFEDAAE